MFLPLWIWYLLVVVGATAGIVAWVRNKRLRLGNDGRAGRCARDYKQHSCHCGLTDAHSLPPSLSLPPRQEPENVYHFKALVLSPILQLPVFLTELLVAINLDTGDHLWRAIFTPLYILLPLYLLPCIWSCLRKRSVEVSGESLQSRDLGSQSRDLESQSCDLGSQSHDLGCLS